MYERKTEHYSIDVTCESHGFKGRFAHLLYVRRWIRDTQKNETKHFSFYF
jgi:hypothetical protein